MTAVEIELLIPLWGGPVKRPVLADPWDRPRKSFRQGRAVDPSIRNRPDFGWALAERLVASGSGGSAVLKRPEFRWVRAAIQFLINGESGSRRLRDFAVVSQAREIRDSDLQRPVVNAALMTRDASAANVGYALKLDANVVEAYASLFFNVLDRKDDVGYIRKVLGSDEADQSLVLSRSALPTEEESLLLVGFNGTIADVLRHASRSVAPGDTPVEELSDLLCRQMLSAGVAWFDSPASRRQAPPALVSHAIDFVKKVKAVKAGQSDETADQSGENMAKLFALQLDEDGDIIREGIERSLNQASAN